MRSLAEVAGHTIAARTGAGRRSYGAGLGGRTSGIRAITGVGDPPRTAEGLENGVRDEGWGIEGMAVGGGEWGMKGLEPGWAGTGGTSSVRPSRRSGPERACRASRRGNRCREGR
ncbi:hypothetical protein GCM10009654_08410 [Streptomyces hebeiensis]|uniref:Uncharacterized protein n=1 Tax=Streptomyces hebeiensis TaxID=229486 RepID=A0ABN1ULG8_9ACTN